MSQGIIMALNKRTAVVLKPDGQFIHVRRQHHYEIGDSITDLVPVRAVPRMRQRIIQWGVAASALLIFLVGIWSLQPPPVVAYVSMDTNRSIEFGLDHKERVRTLRAVNEDAEAFIEGLDYKGKGLEVVMNEIAQKLVDENILTIENPEVVIASVPMRALAGQWEADVTQTMTRILNEATEQVDVENKIQLDVTTMSLPTEIRTEAVEKGVSSGKMAFWLVSESQGHKVSIETLKEESLKNIAASWGGVKEVMSHYENEKPNNIIGKNNKENIKQDDKKSDHQKPDHQVIEDKKNNTVNSEDKNKSGKPEVKSDNKNNGKENKGKENNGKENNGKENNGKENNGKENNGKEKRNSGDNNEKQSDIKTDKGRNNSNNNNNNNNNNNKNNEKSDGQKERWKQLLEHSKDKEMRQRDSERASDKSTPSQKDKSDRREHDNNRK